MATWVFLGLMLLGSSLVLCYLGLLGSYATWIFFGLMLLGSSWVLCYWDLLWSYATWVFLGLMLLGSSAQITKGLELTLFLIIC